MRVRTFLSASLAMLACCLFLSDARAGRQSLALFPPQAIGLEDGARGSTLLGQILAEKLGDRFDVHLLEQDRGSDPGERRRKARALGATYVLTGAVSRIGRTATLDLTIAPTEDPEKGRTVFVTAEDGESPAGGQGKTDGVDLPFAYRTMATEASDKLSLLFFGGGQIGEGGGKPKIPPLPGKVSISRNIDGNVVSLARGDTDRDGKPEIAAATSDSIALYRLAGEDLSEKARIPEGRGGIIHIDIADLNRNGIGDVVAVRHLSGKASSDIWEFDGKEYRRIAKDIPYFLRTVDLGDEGVVLVGQESDPEAIFKGPVFRVALERYSPGDLSERGDPIPLPGGTWIYSFVPVRFQGRIRYVSLGESDRLILLGEKGEKLWMSIEAVSGTAVSLEAADTGVPERPGERKVRRLPLPGRLFAEDLNGDKADEIVVVNNIVSAGGFFENLRIFTNAEVLCFVQVGDSLALAWRTSQIDSPAMDAILEGPRRGTPLRIGIASRNTSKILGKFGEWRIYWMK